MSNPSSPTVHDLLPNEDTLDDFTNQMNQLSLFGTAEQLEEATSCPHVWTIEQHDQTEPNAPLVVRCIWCSVSRILNDADKELINKSVSAGMQFVQWPQKVRTEAFLAPGLRLAIAHAGKEIVNSKADRKRARKRLKSMGIENAIASTASDRAPRSTTTNTGGSEESRVRRVEMTSDVPAGFGPVADVAASMGMEAKKLRKMIRDGKYQGVKVGANIWAKIPEKK